MLKVVTILSAILATLPVLASSKECSDAIEKVSAMSFYMAQAVDQRITSESELIKTQDNKSAESGDLINAQNSVAYDQKHLENVTLKLNEAKAKANEICQ